MGDQATGKDVKMIVYETPVEPLQLAPMEMVISVGFGGAQVTRDDEVVWQAEHGMPEDELWTVQDAEYSARDETPGDWRIAIIGPLAELYFQRQGEDRWVLYKKGDGFA